MRKSDIRILVIEDDTTLGPAIEQGLKRAGYNPQLVTSHLQAQSAHELNDFHGLVVDCMLPQKSGVDTAVELIKNAHTPMIVIFTSGVYKDKHFAHDAMLKTRAKAFLQKPFDIHKLIKHFDESFKDLIDENRSPIVRLLQREQYSARDKILAVNQTESIHGFDLPLIYSMLLDPQISGQLHITYDESQPETIVGFNRGQIDIVQFHDKESYFGALLVEKGFATPDEIEKGLIEKKKTPIGQYLVDQSFISPHAIEIVQHEQMIIRLSKTIQEVNAKINFVEGEPRDSQVVIDALLFPTLVYDWIQTKLTNDWLKTFYMSWYDIPIAKGGEFSKFNTINPVTTSRSFTTLLSKKKWDFTLNDILAQSMTVEADLLRSIHFFLVQRVVIFQGLPAEKENFDLKMSRFEKIYNTIKNRNYYDILGVTRNARASDIHRSYHLMAKTFHPDKLSSEAPPPLRTLTENIFTLIATAYQTLFNEQKRKHYNKTLEIGETEQALLAEGLFDEALRKLKNNKFEEALVQLEDLMNRKGRRSETIVYYIWALIKAKRHKSDKIALAARAKEYLSKVPHEDRHNVHFFFVKGMYYELTGRIEKAYEHFKHCEIINPSFTDARREITYIKKHLLKNRNNFLTQDIGTTVQRLFKKQSAS